MKSTSLMPTVGTSGRQRSTGVGTFALLLAVLSLMLTSVLPMTQHEAAAQSSDWAPPPTVYLPESGHTLDRLFLDLWRNSGGAATYGYPITPEITQDNGHVVQYLQYARFEYWPEGDANGNTVLLGKIGEELRPFTVQRSASASNQSAAIVESTRQMKAWLPVSEKSVDTTREDLIYVEATQHTIGGGFLSFWYNTGDEAYLGNPLTEEYVLDGTTYQVFERGQLSWKQGGDVELVPVGKVLAQKYGLDTEPIAQGDIPTYSEDLFIEPEPDPIEVAQNGPTADGGEIWIDVNLSSEYMTVYQGNTVLLETYVSTGRPGFDTPPGTYYINTMLPEQDMEGVIGGEYYNVPSVPDVMYFTDVGHAIHGTYWHNNFGTPMSHGCVNMPMGAADYLYSIATIGTRVEIHW